MSKEQFEFDELYYLSRIEKLLLLVMNHYDDDVAAKKMQEVASMDTGIKDSAIKLDKSIQHPVSMVQVYARMLPSSVVEI